jgi:DNA-binding PadR family transcriptional regulator
MDMSLTENEGSLLGLIVRQEPLTAHAIIKLYRESPVSQFNNSKGAVYPQVRRLKARGFLSSEGAKDELVKSTALGREALRTWVKALSQDHIFLPDPVRYRMLLLDLLTRDEQIEWAVILKRLLTEKVDELQAYHKKHPMPFADIVQTMAVAGLELRSKFVDDLLFMIVRPDESSRSWE